MIKFKEIKTPYLKGYVFETKDKKQFASPEYNYMMDKNSGLFVRYGKTLKEDASLEAGLPEIADIEISTICSNNCEFCYKDNRPSGKNMSLKTFKQICSKLPPTVTQIAFGIGDIDGNKDMFEIFKWSRKNGFIPNVTINGSHCSKEKAIALGKVCGAVAVSYYDKEETFDTVKLLLDMGLSQVNIHSLVAKETYPRLIELLVESLTNERLKNLNAVVLLGLKQKGRAKGQFSSLCQDRFKSLVSFALANRIRLGFDSCSAFKFLNSVPDRTKYEIVAEPCESSIYSVYIDVDGNYYPCSFMEGEDEWKEGLNVIDCNDFLEDIWYHSKTINFRNKVIKGRIEERGCCHYEI